MDNYQKLAMANLDHVFRAPPPDLADRLGGTPAAGGIALRAFGRNWVLNRREVSAADGPAGSVEALLISIYARHSHAAPLEAEPFMSFKDLPGSAPYAGAFAVHAQQSLAHHVAALSERLTTVCKAMDGAVAEGPGAGDIVFTVRPLPKIALQYICYHADDDFPASVTCLFSRNAPVFMPTDALADVGEYTAKAIIDLIGK